MIDFQTALVNLHGYVSEKGTSLSVTDIQIVGLWYLPWGYPLTRKAGGEDIDQREVVMKEGKDRVWLCKQECTGVGVGSWQVYRCVDVYSYARHAYIRYARPRGLKGLIELD